MSKNLNDIKKTGFKVPKDYFDTIEDAVFSKLKTDDILNTPKDTGFTMPKNYLDGIEDSVFKTIKAEKPKVVSLVSRQQLLYISGVAAALVLLFSIYIDKGITIADTELTPELVENYIINQDISSYELAALLTEEELSSINSEIMDEAFSNEDMEDYLLENINIEDIIEH